MAQAMSDRMTNEIEPCAACGESSSDWRLNTTGEPLCNDCVKQPTPELARTIETRKETESLRAVWADFETETTHVTGTVYIASRGYWDRLLREGYAVEGKVIPRTEWSDAQAMVVAGREVWHEDHAELVREYYGVGKAETPIDVARRMLPGWSFSEYTESWQALAPDRIIERVGIPHNAHLDSVHAWCVSALAAYRARVAARQLREGNPGVALARAAAAAPALSDGSEAVQGRPEAAARSEGILEPGKTKASSPQLAVEAAQWAQWLAVAGAYKRIQPQISEAFQQWYPQLAGEPSQPPPLLTETDCTCDECGAVAELTEGRCVYCLQRRNLNRAGRIEPDAMADALRLWPFYPPLDARIAHAHEQRARELVADVGPWSADDAEYEVTG